MTPEPSNEYLEAVDLTEEYARMVLADELQACFPKRAEQCRNGLCDPEIPLQEAVDAMICFARRAALSALSVSETAGRVQLKLPHAGDDGWLVVPREPTEAMKKAGWAAQDAWDNDASLQWGDAPEFFWKAMIAATPPAKGTPHV